MRQRRIPYYEGQSRNKKNCCIHIRTALLCVWLTASLWKPEIKHCTYKLLCCVTGSAGYVKGRGFNTGAVCERKGTANCDAISNV